MEAAVPARVHAPLLEVRGVGKSFGRHVVLASIDLVVERGETVVILGRSGCGKSTLARIIAGLEPPSSGRVLFDGVDVYALRETAKRQVRQRLAMVFQARALLDGMDVFENVAFPLREQHLPEPEIRARVLHQLEVLGLAAAAHKLPAELSGGMAKRVGIARAMVIRPALVIYDEPTSGLDPVTSRAVDELIDQLRDGAGVASLVITHDMATAYNVADRVLLLDQGVVAAQGDPGSLFEMDDERIRALTSSSGVDPARLRRGHRRLSGAAPAGSSASAA
jgi:phospholipid/cholesterol/gamma-HCH transport system ATP-binding protein